MRFLWYLTRAIESLCTNWCYAFFWDKSFDFPHGTLTENYEEDYMILEEIKNWYQTI